MKSKKKSRYQKENPKILIIIKGGMVDEIMSTTTDIEITVIDDDVEVSATESSFIYYRSAPDQIISGAEYENTIEEAEDEQLNDQDDE